MGENYDIVFESGWVWGREWVTKDKRIHEGVWERERLWRRKKVGEEKAPNIPGPLDSRPALRSIGVSLSHWPVRMQPTVTSHHSGTRGRIKARRSPSCRPQVCVKTLAAWRVKSAISLKLHFSSSPWLFTHHRAGFGLLLPSWSRSYTMYYFLLQRKRALIWPTHCHSHIPVWAELRQWDTMLKQLKSQEKLAVGVMQPSSSGLP